jgi:hypothetical protein
VFSNHEKRLFGGQVVDLRSASLRGSIGPPIMVMVFGSLGSFVGGHQRDRGQHRHGRLADRDHVHVRAKQVADEVLHVIDVVVQVERAVRQRHHARIGPVGDEDVVVGSRARTVSRSSVAWWPDSGATSSTVGCLSALVCGVGSPS